MPVHLRYRVPDVSIHLMLLFIMSDEEIKKQYTEFQYISCYSLSKQTNKDEWFRGVSIHLMLLFIRNNSYYPMYEPWFQYISCYSLSERSFRPGKCYHVSIHLMLLFIIKASNEFVKMAKFQYISCYSLSTFWTYMNTLEQRFNTSHVTLYRRDVGTWTWGWCVSIHLMLLFISQRQPDRRLQWCFNTSHVTLYRQRTGLWIIWNVSFNTSHVTLYHIKTAKQNLWNSVSIHLMLLFIRNAQSWSEIKQRFQYISCYSLSARRRLLMDVFCSFNTSHVTLYQITRYLKQLIKRFQYISCYSLS